MFALQPQDWSNLGEVLLWIATGPGGVFLSMYVLSYLAETFPQWHTLPGWVKRIVPVVIATIISLGAQYILKQPGVIEALQPFWSLLILIFIGVGASLMGHDKARETGATRIAKDKIE